jgi:hypothetical protein
VFRDHDFDVECIRALNPTLNATVADLRTNARHRSRCRSRALGAGRAWAAVRSPVTIKGECRPGRSGNHERPPPLANLIAPSDAPIVRNLRRAGAIIVGRTNMPEVWLSQTAFATRLAISEQVLIDNAVPRVHAVHWNTQQENRSYAKRAVNAE